MIKLVSLVVFLASALLARAGITQADFSGLGNIFVLNSSDWQTATPENKVGCIDDSGKFINPKNTNDCGVFSRLVDYPYTLSTKKGNCTFNDKTQEKNSDSWYGKSDTAWSCMEPYDAVIYDELYTIDGFPYVFLCFGDIACYYDAKGIPEPGEKAPLWQFRWGSHQTGITPGHIQLQLLWNKVVDTPKREGAKKVPSPRISLEDGLQIPLQGQQSRS